MIGPTGSGKTFLAQETLAKSLNVPLLLQMRQLWTEAGYVGEDVENILLKNSCRLPTLTSNVQNVGLST